MRLTMLYKIANNLVSVPASQYLKPVNRATRHCHELGYQIPSSTKDFHKHSFFPNTIRAWNGLPPDIAKADTLESFKSSLTTLRNP